MTQSASTAQIRRIHTLSRNAGLDEDTRRDLMQRETGRRSSSELDVRQAIRVIDALQALPGANVAPQKSKARGALKLEGRFVGKIRALWIAGYHLGVVRDRSDQAMVGFIKRQTGIEHTSWAAKTVEDPAAARKVIEALKSWLARVADVQWGDEDAGGIGAKRAVYLAIRRALTAAGVDPHFNEFPGRRFSPNGADQLDELTRTAGERLRQARAKSGGS
ncbi:regulatory protein GemA [Methylopila sp. M107]|uniref:regulatory protein GemA n=1 Tax=Methylopila sp. M107 TaxID=1101190 RepID=UPI00036159BA|nr:regulatory protein GemA [Methylopila sp. M107]